MFCFVTKVGIIDLNNVLNSQTKTKNNNNIEDCTIYEIL